MNDAPSITNGATIGLGGSYSEDGPSAGFGVSGAVNAVGWSDVDTGAVKGMIIVGSTGNGTWQYSTDLGTWNNVGSVSATNGLLLSSTSWLRYVGDNANGETPSVQFRAWDESAGTASTNATPAYTNPGAGGGTTAFSSQTATGTTSIYSVNDAPLLDNTGTMTLTTITEDQTTNAGNTIASIIASAGGDRISDVDSGAVEGIAITALTNGTGTWEYSTDAGGSWTAIGTVSNTSALLLRGTDLVRFIPDEQNGTTGSFDFRAWDQSSGTAGTTVDVSTNGGVTAFRRRRRDRQHYRHQRQRRAHQRLARLTDRLSERQHHLLDRQWVGDRGHRRGRRRFDDSTQLGQYQRHADIERHHGIVFFARRWNSRRFDDFHWHDDCHQ